MTFLTTPLRVCAVLSCLAIAGLMTSCETTSASASDTAAKLDAAATKPAPKTASGKKKFADPPVQKITLKETLAIGDGVVMKKMTYPPGVYTYVRTNMNGHFYRSPNKIKVFNLPMTHTVEGGIFWKHGAAEPRNMWWTTLLGMPIQLPFKENLTGKISY